MHICTNTHTDCSCEEPLYYPEHSTIYFPLTLRMKQKYTDYLPLITLTSLTKPHTLTHNHKHRKNMKEQNGKNQNPNLP